MNTKGSHMDTECSHAKTRSAYDVNIELRFENDRLRRVLDEQSRQLISTINYAVSVCAQLVRAMAKIKALQTHKSIGHPDDDGCGMGGVVA